MFYARQQSNESSEHKHSILRTLALMCGNVMLPGRVNLTVNQGSLKPDSDQKVELFGCLRHCGRKMRAVLFEEGIQDKICLC